MEGDGTGAGRGRLSVGEWGFEQWLLPRFLHTAEFSLDTAGPACERLIVSHPGGRFCEVGNTQDQMS